MKDLRKKGVIKKLADECRDCYIGRIPFIAVDTYDKKMLNLLIEEKNIIDFYKVNSYGKILEGLEEDESVIDYAYNFHQSLSEFEDFISGKEDFGKVPQMFALRISDSKSSEGIDEKMREALISYVDLFAGRKDFSNCVILYGNIGALPRDIQPFTETVTVSYPEMWEIREITKRLISENQGLAGVDFESEGLDEVVAEISGSLTGFSVVEIEDIVCKLMNLDCVNGQRLLFSNERENKEGKEKRDDIIFFKKQQALNYLGGILQLDKPKKGNRDADDGEDKVLGFDRFDNWIDKKIERIKNPDIFARERGSGSIRGLVLFGVPGCGKSASVKVLKEKLGFAVLRMDMGSLMGSYVGDSERNMREALAAAEAMAPGVILFIDEIEKGFAASAKGSSKNDSVFLRMFAYMLNWMQEQKNVFIVMTSNDITSLPSEFLRSGRLDGLFSVQMPTAKECVSILKEMMRRSEKSKKDSLKADGHKGEKIFDEKCFEDDVLLEVVNYAGRLGKFLIGSDIEKIVTEAKDTETVEINGAKQIIDYSVPFSAEKWKAMLKKTVGDEDINTYGMSENNLYSVARIYINLFHGGFINVSENALFERKYYITDVKTEDGKIKVEKAEYIGSLDDRSPEYDKLLFENIKKKINAIAPEVEDEIIRKLIFA